MSTKLIKRKIFEEITPWLGKEKILIIKGARQVGKTTLLKQLKNHIQEKFPQSKTTYLLADDLENEAIFSSAGTLETYLTQKTGFPDNFTFLFIDEFQYINQAGQFLKNIFDKHKGDNNLQIIVSGSSSLEITKNQEFLTGRALEFMVERITFQEFFDWKNNVETKIFQLNDQQKLKDFYNAFQPVLERNLQEYLVFGGYPEVITMSTQKEKEMVLSSIIKTYIEKDIVNFLRIENVSAFNKLLSVLVNQVGNLVNVSEIANTLDISNITANKYLDIVEGTYIFRRLKPYYKNVRKEITKMPKIYLLDCGIKSYFERSWDTRKIISGELIENFVYLTLCAQLNYNDINFYRTKSGLEIDFISKALENKIDLIESKYSNKPKINSLNRFQTKYPRLVRNSVIVTKNLLKKEKNGTWYTPAVLLPFVDVKK